MIPKIASTTRSLCLLLACWLLAGCTQWRYELGVPLARQGVDEHNSNATLAQMLDLLGPPLYISATDSGYIMTWEYWSIREDSVGISLGALGVDFMNLDVGRMRAKGEHLLMAFDHQHQMTASSFSHWDNYAGGGMALQPLVSFLSVVDSDDLLFALPQHQWGQSLLDRMSRGLNRESNLNTGQNGLEQRGTTHVIGQQSLVFD